LGNVCRKIQGGEAHADGIDTIVVYRGDGTVLEVTSSMSGNDIPLVIIPGGTANVLSVELVVPCDRDPEAASYAAHLIRSSIGYYGRC